MLVAAGASVASTLGAALLIEDKKPDKKSDKKPGRQSEEADIDALAA